MSFRYDKIYVGAGCAEDKLPFFFSFLADNGILILFYYNNNDETLYIHIEF